MLDAAPEGTSEPSPEPVRRILPAHRIGAFIEIVLCSGLPTQLLIGGLLLQSGVPGRTAEGGLAPSFVFAVSLADAVLVIGLVLLFLRAHAESPREVFLGTRPAGSEMVYGLFLIPAVFLIVVVILGVVLLVAPWLHNVERNPFEDMLLTRRNAIIFGVVVMVAGGVREEIQRAFILRRFEQYLGGSTAGVFIYSTLFGLGHVDQGFDAALATAILGAVWGIVYIRRRSVVAPIVSHAGFNLAQLVNFIWIGRA